MLLIRHLSVALAACLVHRAVAGAQTPASTHVERRAATVITGVVRDRASGLALRGVTVVLQRDGQPARSKATAADGRFRFDSLTAGEYSVEVRHRLFDPERAPVRLAAADSAWVTLATYGRAQLPPLVAEREKLRVDLDSARARWKRSRPDAYQMQWRRMCTCPDTIHLADVRGDSVSERVGAELTPRRAGSPVDAMFDEIGAALADERMEVTRATYDEYRGFPRQYVVTHSPGTPGAWHWIRVDRFDVPPGAQP